MSDRKTSTASNSKKRSTNDRQERSKKRQRPTGPVDRRESDIPAAKRSKPYRREDYEKEKRLDRANGDRRNTHDNARRSRSPPRNASRRSRSRSRSPSRSRDNGDEDVDVVGDGPVAPRDRAPPTKKASVGLAKRSVSPDRSHVKKDSYSSDSDSESSEASLSSEESLEDEDDMVVDTPQVVAGVKKQAISTATPVFDEDIKDLRTLAIDKDASTLDGNGYIKINVTGLQPHAILYSFWYTCIRSSSPKLGLPPTRNLSYSIYNPDVHSSHCSLLSNDFWVTAFNDIKKKHKIKFFATETQFLCGIANIANRLCDLSGDNLVLPDCIQTAMLSFHHRNLNYELSVMYRRKTSTELLHRTFSVGTGQLATTIENQKGKPSKHIY